MPEGNHKQVTVSVFVDVDEGIADMVVYLNAIPGVRTHASCQGTIGEGGSNPYRAQVMVTWESAEAFARLEREFDVSEVSHEHHWGYVHPRISWGAHEMVSRTQEHDDAPEPPLMQSQPLPDCMIPDGAEPCASFRYEADKRREWTERACRMEQERDRQMERALAAEKALDESVKLQSHYATLLNDYDGGKRMTFADGKAWLERLQHIQR
jgi:hypothetical protein